MLFPFTTSQRQGTILEKTAGESLTQVPLSVRNRPRVTKKILCQGEAPTWAGAEDALLKEEPGLGWGQEACKWSLR